MVLTSELVKYLSLIKTNTGSNGGVKGLVQMLTGTSQNVFDYVNSSERTAGISTRYRLLYVWNKNASNEIAINNRIVMEMPSQGGDRYALALGVAGETQTEMLARTPAFVGPFQLQSAITAGASSIAVTTENADIVFVNGSYVFISDGFKVSETIASGVLIGDSIQWNAGSSQWETITATEDVTYPKGRYLGDDTVKTFTTGTSHSDFLQLPDNLYEDEVIGTGNGSNTAPALTTLTNKTKGVVNWDGQLPVVTATCGSTARTVNVAADGSCSGYCSAGQLTMDAGSGVWAADITWTTAPDNATNITITYREKCYTYSGNVATIALDGTCPNNYATTTITFGSGVVEQTQIIPSLENWVETSAGTGTFDESTYPLVLHNLGTEEDTITITFTSASAFTCAGARIGSLAAGDTANDYAPLNPDTGIALFTLDKDGWANTWAASDTVVFDIHGAELPVWWRQDIPAATAAISENQTSIAHHFE